MQTIPDSRCPECGEYGLMAEYNEKDNKTIAHCFGEDICNYKNFFCNGTLEMWLDAQIEAENAQYDEQ